MWLSHLLPCRAPAGLRLPADSWIAGATPAQAARCAAEGKRDMSAPVSAMITWATRGPTPGMVCNSCSCRAHGANASSSTASSSASAARSEEHTSELQSRQYLVCRLLLEKKSNGTCARDG